MPEEHLPVLGQESYLRSNPCPDSFYEFKVRSLIAKIYYNEPLSDFKGHINRKLIAVVAQAYPSNGKPDLPNLLFHKQIEKLIKKKYNRENIHVVYDETDLDYSFYQLGKSLVGSSDSPIITKYLGNYYKIIHAKALLYTREGRPTGFYEEIYPEGYNLKRKKAFKYAAIDIFSRLYCYNPNEYSISYTFDRYKLYEHHRFHDEKIYDIEEGKYIPDIHSFNDRYICTIPCM